MQGKEEGSLALGCQRAGVQRQDKWMLEAVHWPQQNGLPDATWLSQLELEFRSPIPKMYNFLHTESQRRWG